ncbi:thymidine phosphorylase [Trichonephila clavipes]|nr:thymidine phosphorylase [Trichonephila clavipes]
MGDFKLFKIIEKKRNGKTLTSEDIGYFVDSVKKTLQYDPRESFNKDADGIADRCQIGAMLMAIYLKGFNDFETHQLTLKMRDSGHVFQWSDQQKGRIVDKHSTGGVGDKISLILVPALAVCGLQRAVKMGPGKRSKHSAGFKIKVIQFAKENGNRAAAKMFDVGESSIKDGTEDDYLFMEESNIDGENDTYFDDVPEDITEDEYANLFMLSNNGSS